MEKRKNKFVFRRKRKKKRAIKMHNKVFFSSLLLSIALFFHLRSFVWIRFVFFLSWTSFSHLQSHYRTYSSNSVEIMSTFFSFSFYLPNFDFLICFSLIPLTKHKPFCVCHSSAPLRFSRDDKSFEIWIKFIRFVWLWRIFPKLHLILK